jgi:hypothetical protein
MLKKKEINHFEPEKWQKQSVWLKIHHLPALANFSNVPRPGNGVRAATNDAPADGICSSHRLSADRLGPFPPQNITATKETPLDWI